MSLQSSEPSFHRGSFVEEIEAARTDLARKLLAGESPSVESPSSDVAPSLCSGGSGSSTPETKAAESPITPASDGEEPVADSFAFAFDIDGVLVRGGRPIPEAIQAMKVLNGENEYGIKM